MVNENPAQKLSRIAKEIQNETDPVRKKMLEDQLLGKDMSSAEMKQQLGRYSDADMEIIEK